MPAAGRLDRLVMIQALTNETGETGEPIETWTDWQEAWMGKMDVRATERLRASQELAEETTVWHSHWIEDLTPSGHRIVYDDTTYDILGLAELQRRAGWEITTKAVRL